MMTKTNAAFTGLPTARTLPFAGLSLSRLRTALRVAAERRALAALDPAALADMGISPAEAAREVRRSFWDLPAGR